MRVLVTRPAEDAAPLVAALAARGHDSVVEPMLTIAPAKGARRLLDLDGVQALLFTSANGVRVFADLSDERALPAFTVGEAGAAAARAAGFTGVESAGGDVTDLVRLVSERLDGAGGVLFHGAARKRAGDLKGGLESAGFTLRRIVLYDAKPARKLSAELRGALAEGRLDAVTFFSPRTAETFVRLVEKAGLGAACARLAAVCLSQAVAEKVEGPAWGDVRVAERPDQDALLDRLDATAAAVTRGAMAGPHATDKSASQSVPTPARPGLTPQVAAQRIVSQFGGIRPMAGKLGVAVSTVQGWRARGSIPASHHDQIRSAAETHGVDIDPAELALSDRAAAPPPPSPPEDAARAEATSPGVPTGAAARDTGAAPEPPAPGKGAAPAETAPSPGAPSPGARPPGARPPGARLPGARLPGARSPGARSPSAVGAHSPSAVGAHSPSAVGAWLGGFVLGVVVLALGAGGAVIARDLWMPWIDFDGAAEMNAGPVQALERRVAALESAQGAGDADALETLRAERQALEQALTAQAERVAALDRRLGEAEAALSAVPALAARVEAGAAGAGEASEQSIAEIASRLESLTALEMRVEALSGLEEDIRALTTLETRIEALAGLEQRVEALAALEGRVDNLAQARRGAGPVSAGETALALAVLQLRDALRGSGPFAPEFKVLQDLAASGALDDGGALADLITPLGPHAATGVAGLAVLKAEFPAVAREIITQAQGGTGDGWLAGVLRRVSGLVTVRRVGLVEGHSPGAVVARAEAHVMADDLAAALDELAALSGPAAEAARPWRERAAERLGARRVLTGLGQFLVARLTPAGG